MNEYKENYQSNLILLQEVIAKLRRFIDIKILITHLAINIDGVLEFLKKPTATNDSRI
jgi:hypothetical protein